MAALLTQQQQQQQAALSEVRASPVLAKLLSPATAYWLLDVWVWLVDFAPWSALGCGAVLGAAELVPTIQPVANLAAAAAHTVASSSSAATATATASGAGASRAASRSSSNGGVLVVWQSTLTDVQLMQKAMEVVFDISTAINNEYKSLCERVDDAGERIRYVGQQCYYRVVTGHAQCR
jgi:hypothetical protein